MRILITGICGFVGGTPARGLQAASHTVTGFDNFVRPGSETNRASLAALGIKVLTADLRDTVALSALPAAEFVLDAAANPSVLAGVDGKTSSRERVYHRRGVEEAAEEPGTGRSGTVRRNLRSVGTIVP